MSEDKRIDTRTRVVAASTILLIQVVFVLILSSFPSAEGQNNHPQLTTDDINALKKNPSSAKQAVADLFSRSFANLSKTFGPEVKKHLGFCILDVDKDWSDAFNFSSDTRFIENCFDQTKGDIVQRLCTAADIKFYFTSLFETSKQSSNYAQPNKNCNLTSWVDGCEPGWACKAPNDEKIDVRDTNNMPHRTDDCAPCCAGFFCPHGLTCMMPCPLGAYCPRSTLNRETGVCDPYRYQLSPGMEKQSCGSADIWADIKSGNEIFCAAGSYCGSTIEEKPCNKGFYCRTGSTAPQKCFNLARCEEKSGNQNIQAYGALIFVALSFVVIIIYNCSDQVLSTREKRKAVSREKAVQSVRETQAKEKWKSAKEIAIGLQTQLSRTFSRKKSSGGKPPVGSEQQSAASEVKKKEKSDLTKMIGEIEGDTDSQEGFSLEMGDKKKKKGASKGKNLHSQSQMFRYAYGQIEKEKAMQEQNKNLSFSGMISMSSDIEVRKRLMIEVYFKDLTLTLRVKNKHIMRSVTGKLSPGRVTAVMGPSGAGKTTFLSALTGKISGCDVSGLILINGKSESIQAYKKIIGFVPQDDIVHGNLTVEENLWFSARCRLPANLPQQDKVLVVERVIECLGLQLVRDSLVGTVEKRGISGGQRKRVNVGLEMVMEPSLLILDEPTSGLDSSSSQLLLRALRREALEGVNVSLVVHQPSYSLFRMFDDLILLAKGGLIVYHGPVKKVEEYFSGIGIPVPDRVNPPDHYIDILEGIVKLNASSGVTVKQLPVRWMLHNGYPVPSDMLDHADGVSASSSDSSSHGAHSVDGSEVSLAGELWEDVKCNVVMKKESILHNYLSSRDLSNRKTPNAAVQFKYFIARVGKQRLRESREQAVDYLILCLAGVCLGTVAKVSDETFGVLGYTYTVIAVSLLCKIAALRSFSLDKLEYKRENSSGMSSLAYFLAKDTVDHFNTIIKPWVYLSMFYYFNNPRSSVVDNYIVLVCLVYCVTGIAYVLAICCEQGPAQLWSVLLPVVLTLVATQSGDSETVKEISKFCYSKWALEAFVISNAKRYSGVWLITRCGSLYKNGYDLNHWNRCLILLLINGLVGRCIAFICMVSLKKK